MTRQEVSYKAPNHAYDDLGGSNPNPNDVIGDGELSILQRINDVMLKEFGKEITGNPEYLTALLLFTGIEVGNSGAIIDDSEVVRVFRIGERAAIRLQEGKL
jgi:hypothetical protein